MDRKEGRNMQKGDSDACNAMQLAGGARRRSK